MTTEEDLFVHYVKSYTTGRLGVQITAAVPFKDGLPRHCAACVLGIVDGVMHAEPKTKSQVVAAVEALLL